MSGAKATTRALWIESAGRARLREEPIAPPESGWCSVDALYSAVSPGTERLVAGGRVPAEVAESMRGPYMEGSFAFPVKYGYSLVGRVSDGSDALQGRLVHVLHPHQERCTVRISDVVPLPDGVPPARATLAANLQTAVTAMWDSHITAGERALVVGFGIIGSLVARLASRIPGVELDVLDIDPDKRSLAERLGFTAIDAPRGEYDLAFGASGSAEEVQIAMDALGDEGRLVELSWLGTAESRVAFGGAFHSGRKRIIGSQVSHIPPHLRGRWTLARRARLVLSLLRDDAFDQHITSTVDFDALPAFFEELCRTRSPGLSVAVRYPAA